MAIERIPVSLRVDTESDMWLQCGFALRENRRLTPVLEHLLNLYFESPELREIVDYRIEAAGIDIDSLIEQLERVSKAHSASVQYSAVLKGTVGGGRGEIESRLDSMQSLVDGVNQKMDAVLSVLTSSVVSIGTKAGGSGNDVTDSLRHPEGGATKSSSVHGSTSDMEKELTLESVNEETGLETSGGYNSHGLGVSYGANSDFEPAWDDDDGEEDLEVEASKVKTSASALKFMKSM